jgi:hypothetical protein
MLLFQGQRPWPIGMLNSKNESLSFVRAFSGNIGKETPWECWWPQFGKTWERVKAKWS